MLDTAHPVFKIMQLPFFVYGTLRPGGHNFGLVSAALEMIEPAHMDDVQLYNCGFYPMAVEGNGRVLGELLTLSPDHYESALAAMDVLEGVLTHAPTQPGGLYRRARRIAEVKDGMQREAWIYLGAPEQVRSQTRIVSGDWFSVVKRQ